ncbi:MAG: hypothetical protein HUU57_15405 [Bdellovibrio sp.]|nr:hypothetical protein [Bdellovibrio sp.]
MLAGDEHLLRQLPKGKWIGGTIPYFMSEVGGVLTHDQIQVTDLPEYIKDVRVKTYAEHRLEEIPKDYDVNGVSFVIIPAFTNVHQSFAKNCSSYKGIFDSPLIGWITGIDLKDVGAERPKVFNGTTGESFDSEALVMHVKLPANKVGKVNILNLFKQGNGDVIRFVNVGFEVKDCYVNGDKTNFAEYLARKKIDTQLPLVANYMGAMINVSFQSVDSGSKKVSLYAPVFPDVDYVIADPVENYENAFLAELKKSPMDPTFSCNCILNYLYANLEGKKTGHIVGPITFGEVAYMLLNQTMVYLTFEDRDAA